MVCLGGQAVPASPTSLRLGESPGPRGESCNQSRLQPGRRVSGACAPRPGAHPAMGRGLQCVCDCLRSAMGGDYSMCGIACVP